MKIPTLEERIESIEKSLSLWTSRLETARDAEDSQVARHWMANCSRVLARLRKQQAAEAGRVAS